MLCDLWGGQAWAVSVCVSARTGSGALSAVVRDSASREGCTGTGVRVFVGLLLYCAGDCIARVRVCIFGGAFVGCVYS